MSIPPNRALVSLQHPTALSHLTTSVTHCCIYSIPKEVHLCKRKY